MYQSYTVENFSKPGDNHSSFITGIKAKYIDGNGIHSVKYVVKLNPQKSEKQVSEMISLQFKQEVAFLYYTVPTLNSLLEELNQTPLCVPSIIHYDSNKGKEVIFMNDLREKGFVLTDRFNTLDKQHVKLVISEYGRIHAASRMLFDKYGKKTVEEFKLNGHPLSHKIPVDILRAGIKASIETGIKVSRHWHQHRGLNLDTRDLTIAAERLKYINENVKQVVNFVHEGDYHTYPFVAVIHHDCWINNYMFR